MSGRLEGAEREAGELRVRLGCSSELMEREGVSPVVVLLPVELSMALLQAGVPDRESARRRCRCTRPDLQGALHVSTDARDSFRDDSALCIASSAVLAVSGQAEPDRPEGTGVEELLSPHLTACFLLPTSYSVSSSVCVAAFSPAGPEQAPLAHPSTATPPHQYVPTRPSQPPMRLV